MKRHIHRSIYPRAGAGGYSGAWSSIQICFKSHTIGGGAIILCKPIATPSKTARRQAHPIAELRIDRGPPDKSLEP